MMNIAPVIGRSALMAAVIGTTLSACSSPSPAPQASSSRSASPGPKPTIVMIHGAWADTASWDGEVAALTRDGYDARAIANPLQDLTSDAASVKAFLATLSGPVVVVGHSYGGAVITNAAAGNPNVKALVYVDAVAPDVGEANTALIGAGSALKTMPDTELYDEVPQPGAPADLYLKRDVFEKYFASDLSADAATTLWSEQRAVSAAAFSTPTAVAAWKTIPSWFFISSGDQIITADAKSAMATRARSHVTDFAGGSHLTLVSHPDAVTKTIEAAAG